MNEEQFKREYLCEWQPDPNERALYELAERYHQVTEAYDRTVCTGPIIRGSIMPEWSQMGLVNRNARKVFNDLLEGAYSLGITAEQLQRAISRYPS